MKSADKYQLTQFIKESAIESGFSHCGISPCSKKRVDKERLLSWLQDGYHASMEWMENYIDLREDPTNLLEGAKSVISVLFNYFPEETLSSENNYVISKYAYGEDYHFVIRRKLKEIINKIEDEIGPFSARAFTDSAPVFDRSWAAQSGLGWIGKNTCLINPKIGSFFFIGEIICDLELEYDTTSVKDMCGGCHKCIDACPTGAIVSERILDSNKCISYHTIENKGSLPESLKKDFGNMIFGCDICQDVCPWNRISKPHSIPSFNASEDLKKMNKERWESLSEDEFKALFRHSPVKRVKYNGLMRNINFVKNNQSE